MKVAFIHNEKKLGTGANYINDLMASKLRRLGVEIKNFYPRMSLENAPTHLGGLRNILFFYSLLERRGDVLRYDIIQGSTYTPLPFLAFSVPVISHFGSTTRGFMRAVPLAAKLESGPKSVWYALRKQGVIPELNIKTRRPLRDIQDIEEYVASHAAAVIATSEQVRQELLDAGVNQEKICLIHNAIEDYWFGERPEAPHREPRIVFLGRLGNDVFTLKLKGLDRLVHLYEKFPDTPKHTFCITTNKPLAAWLRSGIPNHSLDVNTKKDALPAMLGALCGSILFIPSRYEGFSLSLVEGMSQGLVPVVFPVGVAPEIIRDGENGYLVNSQEEAIERVALLLRDTALREALSEEARKSSRYFTSDEVALRLIQLYQSFVAHEARR